MNTELHQATEPVIDWHRGVTRGRTLDLLPTSAPVGNVHPVKFQGKSICVEPAPALRGFAATFSVRVKIDEQGWNAPILSQHGGNDRLNYHLFTHTDARRASLVFALGVPIPMATLTVKKPPPADMSNGMFRVSVSETSAFKTK